MKRIKWEREESVALMNLYFSSGAKLPVEQDEVANLSKVFSKRAHMLGYEIDEKYRNINGLNMQLACIHYVVTEGREGFYSASKMFYNTYDLYKNNKPIFDTILAEFNKKYR